MVFFNRQVFLSLHEDIIEFKVCPATRWTYLLKSGQKLIQILFEIITFYEKRASVMRRERKKMTKLLQD